MSNPHFMDYVDDGYSGQPGRRRGWRVLGWISIILSVIMVAGSLTAYAAYLKLQGNINHEDIDAAVGPNRPKKLNNALNILLIGSDSRAGANARYGRGLRNDPPRSDTMILLHLSPGGGQAVGISFPRDLMVPVPSCRNRAGGIVPPQPIAQINSTFTTGGAACTIKTIESFTNIKIDHFMEVDFSGFKNVVNAVGGVEICLPNDVNDPKSKLHLSRGRHLVKGEQALAYVRARHGLGDGSDLSRIKRQQAFLGSIANKALSAGVLANPGKLTRLLDAGTKSLTTDKGLDVPSLLRLGQSLQGLTSGKIRFITVPYGAYAPDPNRVTLRQPAANAFFSEVRNDKGIQEGPKPAPTKVPPSQVRVRVFNASGVPGQAQRVADQLREQGYKVLSVGNAPPGAGRRTQVLYGTGAADAAVTLAGIVPGARPAPKASVDANVVNLVIGTNWTALKTSRRASIPRQQGEIRANQNICRTS
ncbi:MAG TPA: LCP family protein [Streptosporangiaceae bacterium]